ncbi:MAG TPA: PQQ-dependent sugar dehydrogenase [Solirubrobacterales bacterium]|nr:PQQ-dependent sugar dehydrogenase [Solirubrobacterales bacterium]
MIRAGKSATAGLVVGLLLLAGLWSADAHALSFQQVGGGFEKPVYVTSDPGNPDRLFVVERGGTIQVIENGEVRPFADLSAPVSLQGEGGLLSIALAPDFQASGRFFVFYTGEQAANPDIHVAEMVSNGSSAPLASLRDLLTIPHPEDDNHYGGQLQFGPDGALYVSTGDGGGSNDKHENAQDPTSLLGKILRMTPLTGSSAATVWSLGLRNPFRFSFDRLTGDLWIGDVGQSAWEEVNFAPAPGLGGGANFGWNCREGSEAGPATDPECASPPLTPFVGPWFEYSNPPGCAVIGGYVARGPGFGDLYGRYVYGDLCLGEIRSFAPAAPFATDRGEGIGVGPMNLNSFGEDSCGRLYVVLADGRVLRLTGSGAASCGAVQPPAPLATSLVGIRALRRKVPRNKRTLITAWVSPCKGRPGDPVTLWRGRRKMGTRHLDRACTVRFRPRISRRSAFRATVRADETYVAAISRKVTVKVKKSRRAVRRR